MALREILSKLKPSEEIIEFPEEETPKEKITVRIENLTGMVDADRIIKLIREGNILFLKTKELEKKDLGQFQATVQRLKRDCTREGGDIVYSEDGYLVLTPKFARIER